MTRLTTHIREQILVNAQTKSGNRERREVTIQKRKDWDEAVRIASLGTNATLLDQIDAKIEKIRQQIPEDFRGNDSPIQRRGSITVNCAGLCVHANGWDGNKVAPYRHTLLADDPLVQQFHDICSEEKINTENWEKVRASVNAATNSVTTVAKLLKIWPEAK